MESKPKYGIGAMLRHKATNKQNAKALLVIARGMMTGESGDSSALYMVSFTTLYGSSSNDSYVKRAYVDESEVTLFDDWTQ